MTDAEAVVFDLYDTLVIFDWSSQIAMISIHLGVSEETVLAAYDELREQRDSGVFFDAGRVMASVVATCGLDPSPELVGELVAREAEILAEYVVWYHDSIPVLRRLRADGLRTGVISNCSAATRPVVERLGVEDETDVVLLSCEMGESKPSPGIYHAALDALGVRAERAMFVDDRADYLDGAAALGMRTVRVVREVGFGEEMPGGEHPQVSDLDQLFELL